MPVDLHIHSNASDGALSPEDVVAEAGTLGVNVIALTDHDSVEGVSPALRASAGAGLRVLPAVELSSDLEGRDVHFLGYFIDYTDPSFLAHLSQLRRSRFDRAARMVQLLSEAGLEVPFDEVLEAAGGGAVGRSHLAAVMLKRGYIDNIEEAFARYIGRRAPFYVEKYRYSCESVIELILSAGGVAVLAHPGLSRVDEHVERFVEAGLGGIEVYHSAHTAEDVAKYGGLAADLGLAVSGGSDSHGRDSGRGSTIGSVPVPDSVVESLEDALAATGDAAPGDGDPS